MRLVYLFICIITSTCCVASDIRIEGIEWSRDGSENYKVKFTISWNNSWRNNKNHDAAWVFLKYTAPEYQAAPYRHAKLIASGHRLLINHQAGSPDPAFEMPDDQIGLFIYPSEKHRGDIRWTIEVALDTAVLSERNFNPGNQLINVFGIEMVQIPEAAFTIGESDTAAAWRNYSLFIADEKGRPGGLWKINSESESKTMGKEKGNLYYNSQVPIHHGDQKGTISSKFPKGFSAFFIMKYETNQGQYCDFLNSISNAASAARANFGGKDYYAYRGTIRFENGKYIAGSITRPCNFFSWDDACAFADWAGIRPMTELEFEKACRGPLQPIAHEFPWNTNNKDKLQRMVNSDNELVWISELRESDLNENNRNRFGASYYWVLDLAGSLWERCITIGDSVGRALKGHMVMECLHLMDLHRITIGPKAAPRQQALDLGEGVIMSTICNTVDSIHTAPLDTGILVHGPGVPGQLHMVVDL